MQQCTNACLDETFPQAGIDTLSQMYEIHSRFEVVLRKYNNIKSVCSNLAEYYSWQMLLHLIFISKNCNFSGH